MKIANEILEILRNSTINGTLLTLPPGQLDRKTYQNVNDALEGLGGKWNRKLKGHVFSEDPTAKIKSLFLTETVTTRKEQKKAYQFFATPTDLAKELVIYADIQDGEVLLEPSAGQGAIVEQFPKDNLAYLVELMRENVEVLLSKGYMVSQGDFLSFNDIHPDKIVMNPPFSKQQDIDHIYHAWELLKDGGRLVSVVSRSPFQRTNKKSKAFMAWLDEVKADIEDIPAGAFKDSGTLVGAKIIIADKTRP